MREYIVLIAFTDVANTLRRVGETFECAIGYGDKLARGGYVRAVNPVATVTGTIEARVDALEAYVPIADGRFTANTAEHVVIDNRLGAIESGILASYAMYNLGAPVIADIDRITVSVDMKVGAYLLAAQPDVPRNITATRTVVGAADTPGTIVIVGTDYAGAAITETITVGAHGVTVAGTKAFSTVTSVTGAGWVIADAADTITVGVGVAVGLPIASDAVAKVGPAILGIVTAAPNAVVTAPATVSGTTVNLSAATYDGTKPLYVYARA